MNHTNDESRDTKCSFAYIRTHLYTRFVLNRKTDTKFDRSEVYIHLPFVPIVKSL